MTLPVFSLLNAGSLCSIISPMLGFFLFFVAIYMFLNKIYYFSKCIHVLWTFGIYIYLYFHMSDSQDSIVLTSMSIIGPLADLTTILLPCCFFIGTLSNVTFSLCVLPGDVSELNVIVTYPSFNACSSFLSMIAPYALCVMLPMVRSRLRFSLRRRDDLRSYD